MVNKVSLKSFFTSLSLLLDNGHRDLAKHQLNTAFIAWKLGLELGLSPHQLNSLLVESLVHDIGALSIEEKINIRTAPCPECDFHPLRGWYILQQIPNFDEIANAVRYHYASYEELGDSNFLAQIINISDSIEISIDKNIPILEQKDNLIEKIKNDKSFHPKILNAFLICSLPEKPWLDLINPNLVNFFDKAPIDDNLLTSEMLVHLSFLIRDIIDFRSPFTVSHSLGVMFCMDYLAKLEGFSEEELVDISIAGLLHDVGKLTVSNSIIMKEGPLSVRERSIMNQHTYYTYRFLKDAGYSKKICLSASCHHERLDGSGYPFKFIELDELQRMMAVCDVFIALIEDRPYRKGLSKDSIEKIMSNMIPNKLDSYFVKKIMNSYKEIKIGLDEISFNNKKRYIDISEVNFIAK